MRQRDTSKVVSISISQACRLLVCGTDSLPPHDAETLLESGAKLIYDSARETYQISGYAQGGGDVDCYLRDRYIMRGGC